MKAKIVAIAVGALLALPAAASAHHPPTPPTPSPAPVCPTGTTQESPPGTVLICVRTVPPGVCYPAEVVHDIVYTPGPATVQYVDRIVPETVYKYKTKTVVKYKTKWKIVYKFIYVTPQPKPKPRGNGVAG